MSFHRPKAIGKQQIKILGIKIDLLLQTQGLLFNRSYNAPQDKSNKVGHAYLVNNNGLLHPHLLIFMTAYLTWLALQLKLLGEAAAAVGSPPLEAGALTVPEHPEEPPKEAKLPPSKERPVSMMSTEIFSQARKVRSLAKKVLGSTLERTSAFDLEKSCLRMSKY